MKQESAEVLNLDVQKLVEMLNAALCEEWLAYYQYWVGAHVAEGPMRSEVESEMLVHADEELAHANKLIARIVQLGGTPVLSPDQWMKLDVNMRRQRMCTSRRFSNRTCGESGAQSSGIVIWLIIPMGSIIQLRKWLWRFSRMSWNTKRIFSPFSATLSP